MRAIIAPIEDAFKVISAAFRAGRRQSGAVS